MIAEPTLSTRSSLQKENSIADVTSGSAAHTPNAVKNENRQKTVRAKRRAREGSENAKRRRPEAGCGSQGGVDRDRHKNGDDVEAVTLFEVITMGKSAMQSVVDDWIEAYQADRDTALLDLISFFIQCSGCKGVVTAEMFQNKEDNEVMNKMVEELDEGSGLQYKKFLAFPWILTVTWPMELDSGDYPLTMPGPYWKKFRSNFCEFVEVLVSQCQYNVIFDSYLMDTVISLLTELSDSGVRAFRHTCTLAAVKLLTALAGVALNLGVNIDNSQRLYEVEKVKAPSKRASPRVEKLEKKIDELQDRRQEIENMMDAIFKGVFLKRYRDVIPEIRAICMEELCLWMRLYSQVFLNDSYLKYIGWMLHDKQPEVRLKCVLGLQGLYGDDALVSKLDLFTSRFKDRISSMTLDKDHEVAVCAMKLLTIISQTCEDVLTAEDCKHMFQFVYASYRPLASAAGEFVYEKLLSSPEPLEKAEGVLEKKGQCSLTASRMRTLIHFFQEGGVHQHVAYLVDSLWDSAASLLYLLLYRQFLLYGVLKRLVFSSLFVWVWQERHKPTEIIFSYVSLWLRLSQVITAKERKSQMDDCIRLTEHFIVVLPALLAKYADQMEKVTCFLKIPQYFQVDACSSEHFEKYLPALLREMSGVLGRPADSGALEACSRTFQTLCCEDAAARHLAISSRDQLVDQWVDDLNQLLRDLQEGGGTPAVDEERANKILFLLKRVTAFHNAHDLSKWRVYDTISRLLTAEVQQGVPHEVIVHALQCACYAVLWQLNTSCGGVSSRESALAQRSQLRNFCEKCHRCLSHAHPAVKEQAFLSLCDVLTAHSYQLHSVEQGAVSPLLYTPDPKLQKALLSFIQERVFTGLEQDSQSRASESEAGVGKLDELHRRRGLLAAYCKLIVHSVLEMSAAAEIFQQYMKYYNDFGDIIKETLSRTRQMDKIESARTLVLCLQQLFLRLKQEQESGTVCSSSIQTFSSIKELARRFSLTFGWDQIKSRESLALIHRDGIEFVFGGFVQGGEKHTPPYISYLTILSEFSSRLLKPDKKTVYSYLQRYAGEQTVNNREDCWLPLIYYRASLLATTEGEDSCSYISTDTFRQPSTAVCSRPPSLRQAPSDGDLHSNSWLACKTPDLKAPPQLTAAVIKGRKPLKSSESQDDKKEMEGTSKIPQLQVTALKSRDQHDLTSEDVDVDSVDIELT
nr:PREDICTED: cohesin subunit SA-2-like [Lepisosteus oculatus]